MSYEESRLSDEKINSSKTPNHSITPNLDYYGTKIRVKFRGNCLKQDKITFRHKKIGNIYIAYELTGSSSNGNDPTVINSLFGAVRLTRNADIDKYGYSGYETGFNRRGSFSFPGGGFGSTVIIFEVNMSSSIYVDNKRKNILTLGKGPTQGLEHILTTEKIYSINFTVTKNKFYLSLHNNGANSYLIVNGTEIDKSKAKDSEIVATPLFLENISKDWSVDNMKWTVDNAWVY